MRIDTVRKTNGEVSIPRSRCDQVGRRTRENTDLSTVEHTYAEAQLKGVACGSDLRIDLAAGEQGQQ